MKHIALLCIFVGALGCAANTDRTGDEGASSKERAADSSTPVLSFGADWSVRASGAIHGGGKAIVRYDVARLPKCRTQYMGHPAWDILASWSIDGGIAHSTPVTTVDSSGNRVGTDVTLDVPFGHDLAIWFSSSDEGGCQQFDSDFGRNFHFAIVASAPTLHFKGDFTTVIDGVPSAGSDLVIDYSLTRLPWCRQDYNGFQTWDVLVDYRFDGGAIAQAPLTQVVGTNQRAQAPATVHVPSGARTVEMWFENTDRTGCHTWDSSYGRNYTFTLR